MSILIIIMLEIKVADTKNIKKVSLKEREEQLLGKIEKAKQELARLHNKRKSEIGTIAIKYGLGDLSHAKLEQSFAWLAQEISNANK